MIYKYIYRYAVTMGFLYNAIIYMNEVLIRLDEVVFSMSCVYEHIYRTVLIGLIFGQKQIKDRDVYFYGVSWHRRRDPEM